MSSVPRGRWNKRWGMAIAVCFALALGAGTSSAAPFAYITNENGGNVSVVDTATNTVVATVTAGNFPFAVAVNPAGTRAYVTNGASGSLSVIDTATNTVVATVTVGAVPAGVAVAPVRRPSLRRQR